MIEKCKIGIHEVLSVKSDQASNDVVKERIRNGAVVTGTNMYILILAILIASIGLNVDSTAVVIGAMLISPLMGVIISLACGISDRNIEWIRKSAAKFLFQISVSIMTSTVYFFISPLDNFSGELAARTHPTLWDVLIALCGGFAAIIANTRKSTVTNVIPGAAIATALMPPLCTVGYCISACRWLDAAGAFYLFSINSIFICLASVAGLRAMGIANGEAVVDTRKKRISALILGILIVLPSGLMAWQTVNEINTEDQYQNFIEQQFDYENTQVVKSQLDKANKVIKVALVGSNIDEEEIEKIENSLASYGFGGYSLDVTQSRYESGITVEDLEEITGGDFFSQGDDTLLESTDNEISESELRDRYAQLQVISAMEKKKKSEEEQIVREICTIFDNVKSAGFAELDTPDEGEGNEYALVILTDEKMTTENMKTLKVWLKERIKTDIEVVEKVSK